MSFCTNAQDTLSYYITKDGKTTTKENAIGTRKVVKTNEGTYLVKDFYLDGQLQMTGTYLSKKLEKRTGVFTTYYKNGQVEEKGGYIKGEKEGKWLIYYENGQLDAEIPYAQNLLHGTILTYWENGTLKRKDIFSNGEFEKGSCYDNAGKEIEYTYFESMPEFPGGVEGLMNYLRENVIYPPDAKAKGIAGKVFVNFVIGKDGVVRDVKVIMKVHHLLDKEALRVIETMPNWTPEMQRGKKVSVSYNIPINFILKDK